MKKLLFIYNPRSGRGVIGNYLDDIIEIFESQGYLVTTFRIRDGFESVPYISEHGGEYNRIVCAGGDGTLSHIVGGVMELPPDKRPEVGLIPAGSTNDISRSYDLPENIRVAAYVAVTGLPFATDIGSFNDKYFTYVSTFGDLSAVSCFTSQQKKKVLGRAAYITEGIKELLRLRGYDMTVTYDGHTINGNYFLGMVTNAMSVGGFAGVTGPNVDLQDGMYEIALIKMPKDIIEFSREVDAMLIKKNEEGAGAADDLVTKIKAREITFECAEPIQWVIDGEDAGKHSHVHILNNNRAIKIVSGTGLAAIEQGNTVEN